MFVVDGIGPLLCLERKGATMTKHLALHSIAAIEEVATVELNATLVGRDNHLASRLWLIERRHSSHNALTIEAPVVVVATTALELDILLCYVATNRLRHTKIERSALKIGRASCRERVSLAV